MQLRTLTLFLAALILAAPAQAYVGPGLGLGAIGVVAGLFLSLVMAFLAFVWMPIKRVFTRNKKPADEVADDT